MYFDLWAQSELQLKINELQAQFFSRNLTLTNCQLNIISSVLKIGAKAPNGRFRGIFFGAF